MDTRVEHRIPKRQSDCQVEHLGAYALDISDYQQQQHDTGIQQICRIEMSGVASCDYYDSTKVVGNGESGEKHLQRQWHTFAENRQHTERESNVGCHRRGKSAHRVGIGRRT